MEEDEEEEEEGGEGTGAGMGADAGRRPPIELHRVSDSTFSRATKTASRGRAIADRSPRQRFPLSRNSQISHVRAFVARRNSRAAC